TKSILTPTGGFLSAFTHTLNPYVGCQLGNSFCGKYCYANAIALGIRKDAREWGSYVDVKINGDENYEKEYVDIKKKDRPLRIFMSSVTDPYLPIE
ncbi:MAG: radical SAM protein, partial [Nitrosopumilaceae archaeon]|nr:radical SAM protein [Nitrosopumilaceae archaeon]NIU85899.1 radical SAM protein [Nitrosopumilaceae archaeon]NIV64735.1 radical SAM protein [Nitrosopumilaceae archaeon]NIX60132.1 radical SAM protein [Nitrosopumilaceae archaeon]